MSDNTIASLERELAEFLGADLPEHPAADVHEALQVATLLESKGYAFTLRDLCPKSMSSNWRACFTKDGDEFASEGPESALAVCTAAVAALRNA
ncbi:hypothetical protein [Salidesulfovibrio onnuriiensis]|uniref:hypothetical protein n=1 Tax=Salidesulfovibrio onnuriiensis TaxID=2583823 RepID=UPI0011CCCC19|nr:hypothetical protein [Salidesulfovibrio onnuriiensis]